MEIVAVSVQAKEVMLQNLKFVSWGSDFECCHLAFIAVRTTDFVLCHCKASNNTCFPLGLGKQ